MSLSDIMRTRCCRGKYSADGSVCFPRLVMVKGQHSFKVITNCSLTGRDTVSVFTTGNNDCKQILFSVHWWCSKYNISGRVTLNPVPLYYLWRWKYYSEWNLSDESAGYIEPHHRGQSTVNTDHTTSLQHLAWVVAAANISNVTVNLIKYHKDTRASSH